MGILERFGTLIKANINDLIDKMEDPSKMIDQYLLDLREDLAEVKKETAGVMAEEQRAKRLFEDNQAQVAKYENFAKKALAAGNDDDARVFIAKKQELEEAGAAINTAYAVARENAEKMRKLHNKLVADIDNLNSRRNAIKAKVSVAKTQDKVNEISSGSDKGQGAKDAFDRMEQKANDMLDRSNAMNELNSQPVDDAKALEDKYKNNVASVDDELAAMKAELGLK